MGFTKQQKAAFVEGKGALPITTIRELRSALYLLDQDMPADFPGGPIFLHHYNAGRPDHHIALSEYAD